MSSQLPKVYVGHCWTLPCKPVKEFVFRTVSVQFASDLEFCAASPRPHPRKERTFQFRSAVPLQLSKSLPRYRSSILRLCPPSKQVAVVHNGIKFPVIAVDGVAQQLGNDFSTIPFGSFDLSALSDSKSKGSTEGQLEPARHTRRNGKTA
eukprot:1711731-Amphidinium_carterae.1